MSRYTATKKDGTHVVYGYDHALGYFYEEWEDIDNDDMPTVEKDSLFSRTSRSEFVELLSETDAPKQHISNIALDLPL